MTQYIIDKFRQNYRGFWAGHCWFIIIFVVAVLCDAAGTMYFMFKEGHESEIHLAVRLASSILGPVLGPLAGALGKVAAGFIVAVYCRRFAPHILITASIISFWAAWYNIWGAKTYYPNILKWIPW